MKLHTGLVIASLLSLGMFSYSCANGDTVSGSGSSNNSGGSDGNNSGGSNGNGSGGSSSNSSGGNNGNGTGGTSSRGGSTGSGGNSSRGGSTGSGGNTTVSTGGTTGTATGGTTGTTGAGGTTAGTCAVPATALIDDFSSTGTPQVAKPYSGAAMGLTAPTFDTSGGSLDITVATGAGTSDATYAYVGLPFNACTNASGAYKGVKFTISGTLSAGCTIQFSTVDKEHTAAADNGTCTATACYASADIFTLPSTASSVSVAFSDQTGGGAATGAAVVDPTTILNVQWQINVPTAGCTGSITVTNISFY